MIAANIFFISSIAISSLFICSCGNEAHEVFDDNSVRGKSVEILMTVEGLKCESCLLEMKAMLRAEKGVQRAEIGQSGQKENVRVLIDPDKITVEEIIKILEYLDKRVVGYRAINKNQSAGHG